MGAKTGILVLRGSGDTGFGRQERFIKKLNRRLQKKGRNPDDFIFQTVDWYGPLQEQQNKLLERMVNDPGIKLRSRMIRRLLISNIADLITYGGRPGGLSDAYEQTHRKVHDALLALKERLPEGAPLVIMASSMGTEIINNYIWDRQQGYDDDTYANSPFERFETLTGLFTFGNNIPIFAASFDIDKLEPIIFPSSALPVQLQSIARWDNYYDKNDPLGYPVKFVNTKYRQSPVSDIQIGVGNPLSSWNLLSHFGYWTSRKVLKRMCEFLIELAKVVP